MNDNIIIFPKENKRLPLLSFIARYENFKETGKNAGGISSEAVNILVVMLLELLEQLKFDTKDPKNITYLALLLESLKSYVYTCNNIEHPLQLLADKLFYKKGGIIYLRQDILQDIENDK